MYNKSQTTVEFIILTACLFLVFLPILYLLSDYSIKTSSEIITTQVNQLGSKLVTESREMYYLGLFSKEVITVNIPNGITNMSFLVINKSGSFEYYFIVNYTQEDKSLQQVFLSDIPLITSNSTEITKDLSCYGMGTECHLFYFGADDFLSGNRNFKLETVIWNGTYAVNITKTEW